MLPAAYELPAALLLLLGGALACFAGYRLFRIVLGIYGFILGAMLASSMMGVNNTAGMVLAAVVGGLLGALVLTFAYFVGIAIVGAGLAALVAHAVWQPIGTGDPPWIAVVVASIAGAITAMLLQRYVIIVATAFAGAWTMIVAAYSIAQASGSPIGVRSVAAAPLWILYPFAPASLQPWALVGWLALSVVGIGVQLGFPGKTKNKKT